MIELAAAAGVAPGNVSAIIEQLIGAWPFGSTTQGDATAASDIDVLIVVSELGSAGHHDRISQLEADVRLWTRQRSPARRR